MIHSKTTRLLALCLCFGSLSPTLGRAQEVEIKLVVQMTIDQLRGDMPARFAQNFGEGGFKTLMNQGVWFSNAHYRHATTFTAVGHASLFTGGNPQEHGLVGNNWMNPKTLERVYCVEDPNHVILGVETQKKHQLLPNSKNHK